MSIGSLGAARLSPKPGSPALNEALALLSAFGGGDQDLRKLLTEMRDVQLANEALLATATAAVNDANARESAAQDVEAKAQVSFAEAARSVAAANDDLNARREELDAREAKLAGWATDLKAAEDSAHAELQRREAAVRDGEAQLVTDRAAIDFRLAESAKAIAEANALKDEAQSRLDKLVALATGTN